MEAMEKALIYDDGCPVCALYSKGFVKWGLLKDKNRIPFSKLQDLGMLDKIDLYRAKHEIPLVDLKTKQTLYGVDSILFLLKQKLSFFVIFEKVGLLYYLSKKFYAMISFNRKIIIPAKETICGIDCSPVFNFKYRITFIVFASIISILLTALFGTSVEPFINGSFSDAIIQMLLICGSGWILQGITMIILFKKSVIDYLAHLGVIMMAGLLILVPSIILNSLIENISITVPAISVLISSSWMLYMHYKRVKILGLSQWATFGWFFYLQTTAIFWVYMFYFKNL